MTTLTVRGIDDELKSRLRVRAATHGRSMEAEVRHILRQALTDDEPGSLGSRIRERFATHGGVDLPTPARTDRPRAAELGE